MEGPTGGAIIELTRSCVDLFVECKLIADGGQHAWIEERLVDFNLWASSTKASETGYQSLDYFLRDNADVRAATIKLLRSLKACLQRYLLKIQNKVPDAATGDDDDETTESDDAQDNPWSDFSESEPDDYFEADVAETADPGSRNGLEGSQAETTDHGPEDGSGIADSDPGDSPEADPAESIVAEPGDGSETTQVEDIGSDSGADSDGVPTEDAGPMPSDARTKVPQPKITRTATIELNEVTQTLDQLYRISLLLQKTSSHDRFLRADRFLDESVYVELRGHLEFLLLLGFEASARGTAGDASHKAHKTQSDEQDGDVKPDEKGASEESTDVRPTAQRGQSEEPTDERGPTEEPTETREGRKDDGSSERWKALALGDLVHKLQDASRLTTVQQRLIRANILRRNRMLYATARQKKNQDEPTADQPKENDQPQAPETGPELQRPQQVPESVPGLAVQREDEGQRQTFPQSETETVPGEILPGESPVDVQEPPVSSASAIQTAPAEDELTVRNGEDAETLIETQPPQEYPIPATARGGTYRDAKTEPETTASADVESLRPDREAAVPIDDTSAQSKDANPDMLPLGTELDPSSLIASLNNFRPFHTDAGRSAFVRGPMSVRGKPGARTETTETGLAGDYPTCPSDPGQFPWPCPFCGQVLSAAYVQDEKRWRGHVKRDLSPYICVFPDCASEYTMYNSSVDWMVHLREEHSVNRWVCSRCAGEETRAFESSKDWELHVTKTHPDVFPVDQLSELAQLSRRRLLLPIACPLCGAEDDSGATAFKHIALHLNEFALLALPWEAVGGDDSYAVPREGLNTADAALGTSRSTASSGGGDEVDEEAAARGAEILKTAIEAVLNLLDLDEQRAKDFDTISAFLRNLQDRNSSGFTEDDLQAYTRPVWRIRQIISQLLGKDDELTQQPVEQLQQCLQEEHATLQQLVEDHESRATAPPKTAEGGTDTRGEPQENVQSVTETPDGADKPVSSSLFKRLKKETDILRKGQETAVRAYSKSRPLKWSADAKYTLLDVENAGAEVFGLFKGFSKCANSKNTLLGLLGEPALTTTICGAIVLILEGLEGLPYDIAMALNRIQEVLTSMIHTTPPRAQRPIGSLFEEGLFRLCQSVLSFLTALTEFRFGYYGDTDAAMAWRHSVLSEAERLEELASDMQKRCKDLELGADLELGEETGTETTKIGIDTKTMMKAVLAKERNALANAASNARNAVVSASALDAFLALSEAYKAHKEESLRQSSLVGSLHTELAKLVWDSKAMLSAPRTAIPSETIAHFTSLAELTMDDCWEMLRRARIGRDELRKLRMLKDHPKMRLHRHCSDSDYFIPGCLLIKGQARDRVGVFASAVSYASASFVGNLRYSLSRPTPSVAPVIAFFCSLHRQEYGFNNARAIMGDLIAQLIFWCRRSVHGQTVVACRARMDDAGLDELCDLFGQLLEGAHQTDEPLRVVCVIDSVDSFVTSATSRRDAATLLLSLQELAERSDDRFALKLIVTTRGSAIGIGNHFSHAESIDLGCARKAGPVPGLVTRLGLGGYDMTLLEDWEI